jgi:hypothetical protein
MTKARNFMLVLLALLALGTSARAQETQSRASSRTAGPAVTILITAHGVRFAAQCARVSPCTNRFRYSIESTNPSTVCLGSAVVPMGKW